MPVSPEQQAIIQHPDDKHGLVLAVAGSGKSTTMGKRIQWLVEARRVDPRRIVAVMFNKGASLELSEKLEGLLGKRNAPLSITYHRLGTLTLRRLADHKLAELWPLEANPHVMQRFAANVIEGACRVNQHKYVRIVAEVFLGFVDRVKSDLLSPKEVWANGDWDPKYKWFVDLYPVFEKVRREKKIRFMSDLIYDPVVILRENPKAAALVGQGYLHIIVDEYQDIAESQQDLLRFVAGKTARVMAVGDDDQTIYSWRGAKPSYILRDFVRDFPGATVYRLTRTWRYGHALSCAANYVISNNVDRADKLCISGDAAPDTKIYLEPEWDWDETGNVAGSGGAKVLEIIGRRLSAGGRLSDIAILVRAFSRSADTQYALLSRGVPFRLEGGENAFVLENRWVVSLIGWFGVVLGRIAHRPYAGEPDVGSIIELRRTVDAPQLGLSWDGTNQLITHILKKPNGIEGYAAFVSSYLAVSDGRLSQKIYERGQLWRKVRAMDPRKVDPHELLTYLINALDIERAIPMESASSDAAEESWALVQAFMSYVKANAVGKSLDEFMRHLDDLRSFSERAKKSTEAILVTSIHRSKGLEFPIVIMIGLAQGKFPLKPKRALHGEKAEKHLEDERRLFYVGITRAKNELWLLSPPDAGLIQCRSAGKASPPTGSLSEDGKSASQFLYEANLLLSSIMPVMIHKGAPVKAVDPEVFNSYLAECGVNRRAIKLQ